MPDSPLFRWVRYGLLLFLSISSVDGLIVTPAMGQESAAADPSVEALAVQLQNENTSVRRKAADAILNADPTLQIAALPQLIKTLGKEPDSQVRVAILETFRRLGPAADAAVPVLLNVMKAEQGGSGAEKKHQLFRTAIALAAIGRPSVDGLSQVAGGTQREHSCGSRDGIGTNRPACVRSDRRIDRDARRKERSCQSGSSDRFGKVGRSDVGCAAEENGEFAAGSPIPSPRGVRSDGQSVLQRTPRL